MTNKKRIFSDNKKISRLGVAGVLVALLMGAAGAATNYGCDNDDNDAITPELAICSVHAYNIGRTNNDFAAGEKELMRDVIALKTTVITQQMYKQYEYLESTVKRFKTQLEKAVLTTKLQMAGATTSESKSSDSGFSSTDGRFINGVQNCNNELTPLKVFDCLNNNLNTISNSSGNGTNITLELRKQLANDFNVAITSIDGKEGKSQDPSAKGVDVRVEDCTQYKNISQTKQFQACLNTLRSHIRNGYNNAQNEQRKYNRNSPD